MIKFLFFCLIIAASVTFAESYDSTKIEIKIESKSYSSIQIIDTLDVLINTSHPIGGFDFKISFHGGNISIIDVLPGELSDSCRWEYFNRRNITVTYDDLKVNTGWQIVALSEMVPDDIKPLCYKFDKQVSVAKLVISNENRNIGNYQKENQTNLFFLWEDCSDNTIATYTGDILFISSGVDNIPVSFEARKNNEFPNFTGATDDCVNERSKDRVLKIIDFQNSIIKIEPALDKE